MSEKTVFTMLVGVPGSGKSRLADTLREEGYAVHSSDRLREEWYGDESVQGQPGPLFDELRKRVREDLKGGRSVVLDATNLSRKRRMGFLRVLNGIDCRKVCIPVLTPPRLCEERDAGRARTVGAPVIRRMLASFECPTAGEGWDEVQPFAWRENDPFPFEDARRFALDTPCHKLTLGEHLEKTARYCVEHGFSEEVQLAARYHDCGKYYIKRLVSAQGVPTEYAQYDGHENFSSYLFLTEQCCGRELTAEAFAGTLYAANLICWHMHPAKVWDLSERERRWDERFLGAETIRDLMLLHEANRAARE